MNTKSADGSAIQMIPRHRGPCRSLRKIEPGLSRTTSLCRPAIHERFTCGRSPERCVAFAARNRCGFDANLLGNLLLQKLDVQPVLTDAIASRVVGNPEAGPRPKFRLIREIAARDGDPD
jgi:hypothetical protein